MIARCTNPNESRFARYGGRGITVCERWKVFENFYADMGDPPPDMQLDRINNDGNYEPGNCRWATRLQQVHNSSAARMIAYKGQTKCMSEWGRVLGWSRQTIANRVNAGVDLEIGK